METLGPASELSAVCELLASIGEDPVLDLENLPPAGNTALTILRTQSREVQEDPRWFNHDTDVPFTPNDDNEIIIPGNVLEIDGVDADVVQVGNKLYDRTNRSFEFTAPVSCVVTYHRSWDELPSVARRYITALAIERFIEGFPGAEPTSASRQRNLLRATHAFHRAELRANDWNLLNNTSIQTIARRS